MIKFTIEEQHFFEFISGNDDLILYERVLSWYKMAQVGLHFDINIHTILIKFDILAEQDGAKGINFKFMNNINSLT